MKTKQQNPRPGTGVGLDGETCEETCSKCGAQIAYLYARGKSVIVCPHCGEVQPPCSDCHLPEEKNTKSACVCGRCALLKACTRINNLRVGFKVKRVGITARRFT